MSIPLKIVRIFLFTLILMTLVVTIQGLTTNTILLNDLKKFNKNRHHVTNPSGKEEARAYIQTTLTSLGLHTWTEQFILRYPWRGVNIVGVLPGRLYRTMKDRLILIGSHYDTMRNTKGADDDGSGVVAMLQVARQLTAKSSSCTREYSVMFVAFDFEEWEKNTFPNWACDKLGCGSRAFVANFSRYYNLFPAMYVAPYGQLQGAIIMDTMMNFDSTPNSQTVPPQLAQYFPRQYNDILKNNKRGDFLLAAGRFTDDIYLLNTFKYYYNMKGRDQGNKYKLQVFPLPFDGQPNRLPFQDQRKWTPFFTSDHVSFWNSATSYRAIFLSDTAKMRSYMRECYHVTCDTLRHVTIEGLGFLSKSCDTVVMTTDYLTQTRCRNSPHEGLTDGAVAAVAMGGVAFGGCVVAGGGWIRYRRRSSDANALVENDQLEEGRSNIVTSQLEACGNQTSEA